MKKGTLSTIDFQLNDECVWCGGKLLEDEHASYKKQKPETIRLICSLCGSVHVRGAD